MIERVRTFIYFIAPVGGGPIKIGLSERPARRLDALHSWSPYHLELLAFAPGTMKDETAIHAAFLKHHSHGEWFRAAPEIYALINKVRATGSIPVAIRRAPKIWGYVLPRKPKPPQTPEHHEKVRRALKARYDSLRIVASVSPQLEEFLQRTGMSDGEFDDLVGVQDAASRIRHHRPYFAVEAKRAAAFIERYEQPTHASPDTLQ